MKLRYSNLTFIIGLGLAICTPTLFAASRSICPIGPPTAASYTWNFPKEASALLVQMKTDAMQVRNLADQLQELDSDGVSNFWEYDAEILQQTKSPVNAMDDMLCRLETIRRVTKPWEKKAISDVAPSVIELSDSTQDAMDYLNAHQEALMFPAYTEQAQAMYDKSNRIVNFVDRFQEYVNERTEAHTLNGDAHKLGASLGIRS